MARGAGAIFGLVAAGLALAGCTSIPSSPGPSLTKLEARSLPSAVVKQRVLAQMSDILLPFPADRRTRPPRLPLSDLWFWTRPHAARSPGLCTASLVTVGFDPAELPRSGASTPVRASQIEASVRYRFLKPPVDVSPKPIPDEAWNDQDQACRALDPFKEDFFEASHEDAAVEAAWALSQAADQARAGPPAFQLSCGAGASAPGETCGQQLAGLRLSDIVSVEACEPDPKDPSSSCWSFDINNALRVRIQENALHEITHVEVEQVVIIVDLRAD